MATLNTERLFSALLAALCLGACAHGVARSKPQPMEATFTEEDGSKVKLSAGTGVVNQDTNRPVLEKCLWADGRAQNPSAPAQGAESRFEGRCPAGARLWFVDPDTLKPFSDDLGYSLFATYTLLRAPNLHQDFLGRNGERFTAVVVVEESGGSGTFVSVGIVSSEDSGKKGSNLETLGDRIAVTRLSYQDAVLTVDYLDRGDDQPMSAKPTVPRKARYSVRNGMLTKVAK